jgi:6-phosphogluconate dehydrogenase
VCNRSPDKVDATVARAKAEGDLPLKGYKDPKDFIQVFYITYADIDTC